MAIKSVPFLKFVGTVSLGLLTGVSYTISTISLPSVLDFPNSSAAASSLAKITTNLRTPVRYLTALASAPLVLAFLLSPRSARHPYLVYTSLLAAASAVAPGLLLPPVLVKTNTLPSSPARKTARGPSKMDASYEVLGDVASEAATDEDIDDGVNGEEVRIQVEGLARGYIVRTGLAALGFAMAVVGLWGDGSPKAVVYVS